jgi:hypothetical protein
VITLVAPDPPRFCANPACCASLPLARLPANLLHHVANLSHARGAHRMPFGFQPAARIHRPLAMQARAARQTIRTALALRHEAQVFDRDDLGDGETVVYFGELDVGACTPAIL